MATSTRILIADDHPVVRSGLRLAIERDHQFTIVGEASDGADALAQITKLQPAIAVLDIRMPKLDGFAVAREVRQQKLPVDLVFLTLHDAEDVLDSALELGARGYLLKESALSEIIDGLRTVAAGKHFVSPALTGHLLERQAVPFGSSRNAIAALTPAERRVLRLVADYKSNKEIAAALYVHHRTIETHRANICEKLELHGHNALLRFALAHMAEL
jgi:DNA-binding NarL/FixJ family response regulator